MAYIKKLLETGKFIPHIDRVYAMNEMVDAHAYVEKGHKKGNVVISLEQ